MNSFNDWRTLFDADDMEKLVSSDDGLLWLKIKSISRKNVLGEFWEFAQLSPQGRTLNEQFRALFGMLSQDTTRAHNVINRFIKANAISYSPVELESIASELYKMQVFSWGGDYSNALDKFLVDRYIKRICAFDDISLQLHTEIPRAVEGYVLCSWYNHWSTILIEQIFWQHDKVLPAIGKVKKVDFFIDDIPFDLKTTYLPANFVEQRRKEEGLASELMELKAAAKNFEISFDTSGRPKEIAYEIAERIKTGGNLQSRQCLARLWDFRKKLLRECQDNPVSLITNLYEQQGEMRFDASNRLFVVLADIDDFNNSWKLKRNPTLLKRSIHSYLDLFSRKNVRRVTFTHRTKSGTFTAMSDVICIVTGDGAIPPIHPNQ